MSRKRVLLLTSLPPFPARANGFSIRYAPILQDLRTTHDVELALVMDWTPPPDEIVALKRELQNVHLFVRTHDRQSLHKRIACRLQSLVPGTVPYAMVTYDLAQVESFLRQTFESKTYDVLLVTTIEFLAAARRAVRFKRCVIDAIDSVALLARRSAGRAWLKRYDAMRLAQWERSLPAQADYVSYISTSDITAVYGNRQVPPNVGVIPNGLYADDFIEPPASVESGKRIAFLGNMAYGPNMAAATLLSTLLPAVQHEVAGAELSIIGRAPSEKIVALGQNPTIEVTGTVDSIWPYLHRSAVCCFPMREGAGMQNKVLEAMWASRPVVTTTVGNSGIGAKHGKDLLIADTDEEIVSALVWLLTHPDEADKIGRAGRAFVEQAFSWRRSQQLVRSGLLGEANV